MQDQQEALLMQEHSQLYTWKEAASPLLHSIASTHNLSQFFYSVLASNPI